MGFEVEEVGAVVESFRLEWISGGPSGLQPPAQSEVSAELRPGCSGLCLLGF